MWFLKYVDNLANKIVDKLEWNNKIINKELYDNLVNRWKAARKINSIKIISDRHYFVDYISQKWIHNYRIYKKLWNKFFVLLDYEILSKNWTLVTIKKILNGLWYKNIDISPSLCLEKFDLCKLVAFLQSRILSYKISTAVSFINFSNKFSELNDRGLSTMIISKWFKPLDLLVFKSRKYISDKNYNLFLESLKKNRLFNWFEILKAYTDPQVIKANYIIGQEMNNWVGLTEKEIDFYTKWWDYTFKIYVKAEKGSEAYKERVEKWWFKEVKDLWNGIVLLMKEEKVHLEKPILTKEEWEILKKLLTEWKRKILEEKWELKNLKNESKKLQSEIRWNSPGNHEKLHNILQERLKKEK